MGFRHSKAGLEEPGQRTCTARRGLSDEQPSREMAVRPLARRKPAGSYSQSSTGCRGGARAGVVGSSPMAVRMVRMVAGWVTTAMKRKRPPHGHARESMEYVRFK